MRYNPCGYAVDLVRRPYRAKCRFFRNSTVESQIRWVIVPDDTPALPFETVINNSQLEYDRNLNGDIGEVWNGWVAWDWRKYPAGLYTGHYCGDKSDFQNGGIRDATQPVVKFGSFGFPLCCNPPRNSRGGAGAGGIARLDRIKVIHAGATCAAATEMHIGDLATGTLTSSSQFDWYKFIPPYFPYTVSLNINPLTAGAGSFIGFLWVPPCPGGLLPAISTPDYHVTIPASWGGLLISPHYSAATPAHPVPYTLTAAPG